MSHALKIPQLGESITEGTIARWLVADGASVNDTTPVFELETDKISTEVTAGAAGVLKIKVQAGAVLPVGTVVAEVEPIGAGAIAAPLASVPAPAASPAPAPVPATAPAPAVSAKTVEAAPAAPLSPAVRKLVAEHGVDAKAIAGSGKDGRLTKGDVLAAIAAPAVPASAPAAPVAPAPSATTAVVPPASAVIPAPAAATPAAVAATPGETRKRMSSLRQRIAQRLVEAQHTAAILTTFNEIDVSAVIDLRKRFKEEFEKKLGVGLGFMSFFARAACEALRKYPLLNSRIDGTDVVTPDGVHLGIAVGTEKGLVVPVLRDAGNLPLADIERRIRDAALKAREGKLALADLQGGTFTITNGGTYGSLLSTPIINPPQSGILGMHAIKDRPIALNGQVVIRPMMYVALSYDHRIVDGAEAVGFLVRVKELIESPERLVLGL